MFLTMVHVEHPDWDTLTEFGSSGPCWSTGGGWWLVVGAVYNQTCIDGGSEHGEMLYWEDSGECNYA